MEYKPRHWHEMLSKVLWACRHTKSNATNAMPFQLTYRQDVVQPLESTDEDRLMTYENIKQNKEKVARHYNKHV